MRPRSSYGGRGLDHMTITRSCIYIQRSRCREPGRPETFSLPVHKLKQTCLHLEKLYLWSWPTVLGARSSHAVESPYKGEWLPDPYLVHAHYTPWRFIFWTSKNTYGWQRKLVTALSFLLRSLSLFSWLKLFLYVCVCTCMYVCMCTGAP